MKKMFVLMLAGVLACAAYGAATEKKKSSAVADNTNASQTAAAGHANPLDAIGWMEGTWEATATMPNSPPIYIHSVIERTENRMALPYRVYFTVDGKKNLEYYGFYAWNPATKKIMGWQVDSSGDVGIGSVSFEGEQQLQDNHVDHVNGSGQEQHTVLVRDGNDAFNWKAMVKTPAGDWQEAVKLRYTRTKQEKQ